MRVTSSKVQGFATTTLVLVLMVACIFGLKGLATADMYSDSAHGNPAYGVDRTDLECPPGTPCPQGDCTHCHETFDPSLCGLNNYLLFYDDYIGPIDMFCFQCHRSVDQGYGIVPSGWNQLYCVNFGGRVPVAGYNFLRKHFASAYSKFAECGSRHYLTRIRTIVKNDANGWGFGSDPDPCVACHSPHSAQRNHPVAIMDGKLNTAIRRPSDYSSTAPEHLLWGDDADERMAAYVSSVSGTYMAPYHGSGSGTHEPAGDSIFDGSNLPDYVTFCMDCHKDFQYDPLRDKSVKAIVWDYSHGPQPDRHGAYVANDCTSWLQDESTTLAPFDDAGANYVLSCVDCHEPHGTKKRFHLIRRMINGGEVTAVGKDSWGNCETNDWLPICERCHEVNHPQDACCSCCHYHGAQDDAGGDGTGCKDKPLF
ncbi:MAG: hypothetical protein JRI70_05485 [Deltaproteobacteria bacterium]|nr:hypothetical protein [Deltaproteobacteria bacterium]